MEEGRSGRGFLGSFVKVVSDLICFLYLSYTILSVLDTTSWVEVLVKINVARL